MNGRRSVRRVWRVSAGRTGAAALGMAAVLFLLPAALVRGQPLYQQGTETDEAVLPIQQAVQTVAAKDRGRTVRLQMGDGAVEELTMADYLWGVVAAEMPASFGEEALKAQACAARTYTVIQQTNAAGKHLEADLCADSTCCQAYAQRADMEARWGLEAQTYGEKITRAVEQTDGLGILYQGQPIQALFFSSASGKTVDAVEVWGNAVSYLQSVDSPEGDEVPNYRSQVVLTAAEVRELAQEAYPAVDLSGDPSGWFSQISRKEGGTVSSLSLGGVALTGAQVRSLFSLRSAAFTVDWDGAAFTFAVTGYGHGVGMSQYGANAMAQAGSGFCEILTWYYTDTAVGALW